MTPVRYPCQDPTGLAPELAAALTRWAKKAPERVNGLCCRACEDIVRGLGRPQGLRIVGGYALMHTPAVHHGRPGQFARLHWWLEQGDRLIDPTRQQLGRGAVTYWRALPEYQGGEGYVLHGAVCRLVGSGMAAPGAGARVLAELCEREPCYQDQGWQRARRQVVAERRAA